MTKRPWPTRIGILAILSSTVLWIAVADSIRRSATLEPTEVESLLVLLIAGCLLDVVVAFRAYRGRVGWPDLAWLGIRILLSAAGLLLITLPSYVVAAVALSRRPAPRPAEPASGPDA